MKIFKRKQESFTSNCTFYSPADGTLLPIVELKDGMFSEKMMGEGFAVCPENQDVYSPIDGEIVSIFPTKHAIGIKTSQGIEVLIHMGIDTVELNGEGFELYVKVGDKIKSKLLIAKMDIEFVKQNDKRSEIIVVITNSDQITDFEISNSGAVKHNDEVAVCKKT